MTEPVPAPETPQAATRAPARAATPVEPPALRRGQRRWLTRAPLVYYLLAGFDVLAVSASLYLNHRIMDIYVRSVAANHEWARRMADYSALGALAAQVNAPGNDVFHTRDADAGRRRIQAALADFDARLAALREDLRRNVPSAEREPLLAHIDAVEQATREMVAETRQIFAFLEADAGREAGSRMATMDRKYARVLASLRELGAHVAQVQQEQFERQTAAAALLQRFEYAIAASILLMVGAATVYGRQLSRQAAREASQRAQYIAELQAAEESLRGARDELEQRVTERTEALRQSESALRRAAEEWRRTFEAIDSPLVVLDADDRVLRLNRAALDLLGRDEQLVLDRLVEALGEAEPWAGVARVARLVRQRRAPAALEAREPEGRRTWQVSGNLVPDDQGRAEERVIVVARDVTRLVELQESVRREERMAAMGALVGGVAHEVRNPLFGISSTVDALEARHGASQPLAKYLEVLRREVDRLRALMRDLLDYGKPARLDLADAPFDAVVDEAVRLCEPQAAAAGGQMVKAGAWDGCVVRIDRWRVLQALQNVIQNALQHSPASGRVFVEGGRRDEADGAWVVCTVRDEGPGFRGEDLPRLFEPFYSRRSGGTGLGLSIAQRVATLHGGRLEARNHEGGGAVLVLSLPCAMRAGLAASREAPL